MKHVSMDHVQLNSFIVNHSLSHTFREMVFRTWSSWHAGDIFLFLRDPIIKHKTNIFTHASFKYFHSLYREKKVIHCQKNDEDLIDLQISITLRTFNLQK